MADSPLLSSTRPLGVVAPPSPKLAANGRTAVAGVNTEKEAKREFHHEEIVTNATVTSSQSNPTIWDCDVNWYNLSHFGALAVAAMFLAQMCPDISNTWIVIAISFSSLFLFHHLKL